MTRPPNARDEVPAVPPSRPDRSLGRALVGDAVPMWLARLLGAAGNLAVFLLILHRLDADHLGLYYFLVTLWNVLAVAIDFGGEQIATREAAKAPEREGAILRDYLAAKSLLLILGTALFIGSVLLWVDDAAHRRAFFASLVLLPGLLASSFAAVFRVRHRLVYSALSWVVAELLFAAISVTALLTITDERRCFTWLAVAVALRIAISGAGIFLFAKRLPDAPSLPRLAAARPFAFLRISWTQGIAGLSGILYFYVDTIMLKAMVGNDEVGLYNAAYRLLNFFILAAGIIALAALPMLSRAKTDDRFRAVFRAVISAMLLLAFPAAAIGCALADELMTFLYGEKMAVYRVSVPTLRILLIAGVCTYVAQLASLALIAIRRQGTWTLIALVGLGINVGTNAAWIPASGQVGAAWATLVTEVVVAALCCVSIWRARRATLSFSWIVRALPLAAGTYALARFVAGLWFPLAVIVSLAGFAAGAFALGLSPAPLFRARLEESPADDASSDEPNADSGDTP